MIVVLLAVSVLFALIGIFVLTDAGQLLRIGKTTVVTYFRFHMWIMALSIVLFVVALLLNTQQRVLQPWMMAVFGVFLQAVFW